MAKRRAVSLVVNLVPWVAFPALVLAIVAMPDGSGVAAFTSGDAADLREKLARLLALPTGERAAIRDAARRTAVERWSWASVADRLLALGR